MILDLPFNLVEKMLDQASNGEQLIGILEAVTSPDPEDYTAPTVNEQEQDDEPSDEELDELEPEVIDALLEVEEFDVQNLTEELDSWDSIPTGEFITI